MHCTYVSLVRVTMGCRFSADVVLFRRKIFNAIAACKKMPKSMGVLIFRSTACGTEFPVLSIVPEFVSWQIANDGPVALSEGQVIEATWKQLLMTRLTVFRSWFYCLQYLQQRTVTCLCPGKHRYVTFGY